MPLPNGYAPESTTVLIVDDVPDNLEILDALLRAEGYRVKVASNGRTALRLAADSSPPALILLDVMMPDMDGYAVLEELRQQRSTRDIPVIFVTALAEAGDEEAGLQLGAADYVTKPIRPAVLLARVRAQLQARLARDLLRDQNAWLEAEVARRTVETDYIQSVSVSALTNLAAARDPSSGPHVRRTQAYVSVLAQALRSNPRHASTLNPAFMELLVRSAPLHDIGTVGVPDHILQKRGNLDADERKVMQSHAIIGARAIEEAQQRGRPVAFLAMAKDIAHWHHEHWDGTGYPDGLAGDAIPLAARLVAVADVFDAMMSGRAGEDLLPAQEAAARILRGRGTRFDPDVVDAFEASIDAFIDIARQHADPC